MRARREFNHSHVVNEPSVRPPKIHTGGTSLPSAHGGETETLKEKRDLYLLIGHTNSMVK